MSACEHVWSMLVQPMGFASDLPRRHFHRCFLCGAMLIGPGKFCGGDQGDHITDPPADRGVRDDG